MTPAADSATLPILVMDTAAGQCAAALCDASGQILAARAADIGTGHAERLMPMVAEILAETGIAAPRLAAVACSIGPGSFTGVRVGVAAARGMMQALGIAGVPVTTLEAIADEALALAPGRPVRVLIDARRGALHAQDFDAGGAALAPAALLSPGDAAAGAGAFTLAGSGVAIALPGAGALLAEAATAPIGAFCRIAARRLAQLRTSPNQTSLTMSPLYLRGADARPQDGFALARR